MTTLGEGVERFLEFDVRCYHCARAVGQMRCSERGGAAPMFRRGNDVSSMPIGNLAALRCHYCGGPLYVDVADATVRYQLGAPALARPRRGRPPKRLMDAAIARTA